MQEPLTGHGIIVLTLLLGSALCSFWRKLATRDLIFFAGALLTSVTGVIPAKVLFNCIANFAVLILVVQHVLSSFILPRLKWKQLLWIPFLSPFLDHESVLLAFRSRFLQAAFLSALGGLITWFGSPINLAVWQIADHCLNSFILAKMGICITGIACVYFACIKIQQASLPQGNAIVPLGSILTRRGKEEGDVIEVGNLKQEGADLLPLKKGARSFLNRIRWYPLLLLISGLVFASAMQESGLSSWLVSKLGSFPADHPMLYKAAVFFLVFGLAHLFPNILVAALLFPFCEPHLLIAAATCAFLSIKANDVNVLAWGLGRYRKRDFLKFGAPLSLICIILELLWN